MTGWGVSGVCMVMQSVLSRVWCSRRCAMWPMPGGGSWLTLGVSCPRDVIDHVNPELTSTPAVRSVPRWRAGAVCLQGAWREVVRNWFPCRVCREYGARPLSRGHE